MTNEKNKQPQGQGQGQGRSAERNKGQQGEKMTNRYGTKNPKEIEDEEMTEAGEPLPGEEQGEEPTAEQRPTRKPGA